MYSSEPTAAPPLWIWLLLALVMLVLIPVVHTAGIRITEREFEKKTNYVRQRIQAAGARPVILFLGTSLTWYGLEASANIEQKIEQQTGIRPVVVKVWRSATNIETMVQAMPVIEQVQPQILVVEANMLITGSFNSTRLRKFRNALTNVARFSFVNPDYIPDYNVLQKVVPKAKKVPLIRYAVGIKDTSALVPFKQLAMRLQKTGTLLMLVDYPVEYDKAITAWTKKNAALIQRNLHYIKKDVAVMHFTPFSNWDSTYFIDGGHMNKQGRKAFSDWLCTKLSKQIQPK